MRVFVIHNPNSGLGVPIDALQRSIESAGHRIVGMAEHGATTSDGEIPDAQVVVAIGGDGTIAAVAKRLLRSRAMLAILPYGTANNIAGSLAVAGPAEELIRGWNSAHAVDLDLGVAIGPWGELPFIESAGAGLLTRGIADLDRDAPHREAGDRDAMLNKARSRFCSLLAGMQPERLVVFGAGRRLEVQLLMLEVLNIRTVGPALVLAGSAHPGDGMFDVLGVDATQRAQLQQFLRGDHQVLRLPTWRAAEVTIVGCDRFHVDDRVMEALGRRPVTLRIRPAALQVLVP